EIDELVSAYTGSREEDTDVESLTEAATRLMPSLATNPVNFSDENAAQINETLKELAEEAYEAKEQQLGPEVMRQAERAVVLRIIDSLWVRHLTALDDLRNGIGLRAYGQRDPLVEYKVEAATMFEELLRAIQHDVAHTIYHVTLAQEQRARRRAVQ